MTDEAQHVGMLESLLQEPTGQPPRKKRKQRQPLNCPECRRLKLKCDREVPCGNCKRRRCTVLCLGGVRSLSTSEKSGQTPSVTDISLAQNVVPETGCDPGSGTAGTSLPGHPASVQPVSSEGRLSHTGHEFAWGDLNPATIPITNTQTVDTSRPHVLHLPHQQSPTTLSLGHSFGTLRLSKDGRSRYLGPTAASQWLRDHEANEEVDGPSLSRQPSPRPLVQLLQTSLCNGRTSAFPFDDAAHLTTKEAIIAKLPPRSEASSLMESYYRYYSWHFDVAPRDTVQPILDQVYSSLRPTLGSDGVRIRVHPQQLALIFAIFALGARHSLEWPIGQGPAEEYQALAKTCLAKGDFMAHNTIAGVQTLFIMAICNLEADESRSGDSAWPLIGLAMRIIQAMGLHRDGQRWNLAPDVIEQRRRVFWECYSCDVYQSNCFSRPNAIYHQYVDTAFPAERHVEDGVAYGEKGYHTLKFELSQLSVLIIDINMRSQPPDQSQISHLHEQLSMFQGTIPYNLRCRAMLDALPSMFQNTTDAARESPDPSKRDLCRSFQQHFLAMTLTETILYLHRPHFAALIHGGAHDPTRSQYGMSYMTVVERCNAMIQIVTSIYQLFPASCARHWVLWYHSFNAGVCMGVLALHRPTDPLAGLARGLLGATVNLFIQVVQVRPSSAVIQNLNWLLRLQARVAEGMIPTPVGSGGQNHSTPSDMGEVDEIGLLGWRTRLVELAAGGEPLARTVGGGTAPQGQAAASAASISRIIEEILGDNGALPTESGSLSSETLEPTADTLLAQICNPAADPHVPIALDDDGTDGNFWEWGTGFEGHDLTTLTSTAERAW